MRFAKNKMRDTTHARLEFLRCQCQQTITCVMNHLPIKPDVKGTVYPGSWAGTYPPEANVPSLPTSRLSCSPGFRVLPGNLFVCEGPLSSRSLEAKSKQLCFKAQEHTEKLSCTPPLLPYARASIPVGRLRRLGLSRVCDQACSHLRLLQSTR